MTWTTYEQDLDRQIEDLHARVKRGAYRALPSRRSYIPKEDSLEDKIVQRAAGAVLSAIYEEDFLGFSYGFRRGRSQHDALDALIVGIDSRKVNFILDADIRSFLDASSHYTSGFCRSTRVLGTRAGSSFAKADLKGFSGATADSSRGRLSTAAQSRSQRAHHR